EGSVKNVAEAAMREIIGKTDFEYARTSGRTQLASSAQKLIQSILDDYQSGIEIVNVNLQQVDPPERVLDAFRDVQAARADKESKINEGTAYLNETLERAQGQAEQITKSAEAYKEEVIARAQGDAERFLLVYQEYANAKDITKRRIYLQTMEEIMGDLNKILIEPGESTSQGVLPYLPLDTLKPKAAQNN
ncbi:MAG: FtsH protease activity modulator HflK, partial [Pseudomonadota bacterium]